MCGCRGGSVVRKIHFFFNLHTCRTLRKIYLGSPPPSVNVNTHNFYGNQSPWGLQQWSNIDQEIVISVLVINIIPLL